MKLFDARLNLTADRQRVLPAEGAKSWSRDARTSGVQWHGTNLPAASYPLCVRLQRTASTTIVDRGSYQPG